MKGNSEKENISKEDVKGLHQATIRCCCGKKIRFSMFMSIGNGPAQTMLEHGKRSRTFDGSQTCLRVKKYKNDAEDEDDSEDEHNVAYVEDKAPAYPNGLIKDVKFYSNEKFKFVVAKKNNRNLANVDFNTLNINGQSNGCLSNYLMDYLCAIIVPSTMQVILHDAHRIVAENPLDCFEFTKEIVLLPMLRENHWVLFIINTIEATFTYLNSMPNGNEYFDQDFCKNFKRYIKRYNKMFENKLRPPEEWRKKPYLIDYQNDGIACGAFVADYITQFVEKGYIMKRGMNVDECRTQLQLKCLELSDDMGNVCLICGSELAKCLKCKFQCKECKRWMHTRCFEENVEKFKCEDELCCLCLPR